MSTKAGIAFREYLSKLWKLDSPGIFTDLAIYFQLQKTLDQAGVHSGPARTCRGVSKSVETGCSVPKLPSCPAALAQFQSVKLALLRSADFPPTVTPKLYGIRDVSALDRG
jgi:hypothetical protein